MTAYPEVALVWIDTEFSHLDLHDRPEAVFLQVAVLVTDLHLNVLDDTGYEAAIHWGPERIAAARQTAVPLVQTMHDTNGLWEQCAAPTTVGGALPLNTVADELYAYVTNLVPDPRTSRLAGNSISADKVYLEAFMPNVLNHLHYRVLDVSSHTGPAQWWANIEPMNKVKAHTAMEDILESIAEMRYLKERIHDRLPTVSA